MLQRIIESPHSTDAERRRAIAELNRMGSQNEPDSVFGWLSAREREILYDFAEGEDKEITELLGCPEDPVIAEYWHTPDDVIRLGLINLRNGAATPESIGLPHGILDRIAVHLDESIAALDEQFSQALARVGKK